MSNLLETTRLATRRYVAPMNSRTHVEFGKVLKDWREQADEAQERIAAELGVSGKTISRWEQGDPIPLSQRYRICRHYGKPLEDMDAQDFNPPVAQMPDWFRAWSSQQQEALNRIAEAQREILRAIRPR